MSVLIHACHPATWGNINRRITGLGQPRDKADHIPKINQRKKDWGHAQVLEHLLIKPKALNSTPQCHKGNSRI
jgi:hypothetical protein